VPASRPHIAARTTEHNGEDVRTDSDDAVLMGKIAAGDKSAYTEFLKRYLSAIVDFAWRHVGRRVDAEDVAQEAFIRVWSKAPNWRAQGPSPRSWLYRVTYHLCIDELRRRHRHGSLQDSGPLTDPGATPEDNLLRQARIGQVVEALGALPGRQRTAISLCAYHGLSNKEAAATLNITVEALESLLSRGRRRLRQLLQLDSKGVSS